MSAETVKTVKAANFFLIKDISGFVGPDGSVSKGKRFIISQDGAEKGLLVNKICGKDGVSMQWAETLVDRDGNKTESWVSVSDKVAAKRMGRLLNPPEPLSLTSPSFAIAELYEKAGVKRTDIFVAKTLQVDGTAAVEWYWGKDNESNHKLGLRYDPVDGWFYIRKEKNKKRLVPVVGGVKSAARSLRSIYSKR